VAFLTSAAVSTVPSPSLQAGIKRELALDYYRKSLVSSVFFVLVAFGGCWAVGPAEPRLVSLLTVATVTSLINVFRFFFSLHVIRNPNWRSFYTKVAKALILANGSSWAVFFSVLLQNQALNSEVFYLTIVMASAFVAASITHLCVYRGTALLFNLIVMMPFMVFRILAFLETGNQKFLLIPGVLGTLLFFCIFYTENAYQTLVGRIRNEIALREANRELADSKEKLIEQTTKMIHASRLSSVGEMAGGIAHEVNNPLAMILGHVQHLQRTLTVGTEVKKDLLLERTRKIEAAVERISKIIKGLKQFSQQSELEPLHPVPVSQIVQETVDLCGEKFKNQGIELSVHCSVASVVDCRSVQISQILVNLLNNAYDEVRGVESGRVSLSCEASETEVRIRVANTGLLISNEVRLRLFQPFFTTKEIGKGTGLGLSISRGLARDHGGDLTLLEGGPMTTFELRLPLAKSSVNSKVS